MTEHWMAKSTHSQREQSRWGRYYFERLGQSLGMSMSREELFRIVFAETKFPYTAIDLFALSSALRKRTIPSSYITIKLMADNDKNDALRGALRGFYKSIDPPASIYDLFSSSKLLEACSKRDTPLIDQIESENNTFYVIPDGNNLVWEEGSYWPLAYSSIIRQLVTIIEGSKLIARAEMEPVEKAMHEAGHAVIPTFITDRPLLMPTEIHYAVASLGAWLGGAANMHYFLHYACKPQILSKPKNIEYAKKMMYSDVDSNLLANSGLICVPASLALPLIEAQGFEKALGGICINEFGMPNHLKDLVYSTEIRYEHPGFLVDKYYRAVFMGRDIHKPEALYGASSHLRDHYEEFYSKIKYRTLLRCKHNCIPLIDVSSAEEMRNIVSMIPSRGDGKIFFRGQSKLYYIPREPEVSALLFGDSCSIEPSLITYASRNNYNYDDLHFLMKYYFSQEFIFDKSAGSDSKQRTKLWEQLSTDPSCLYDYAVMALAQHYGLPTNGLDVTTSIDVAVWFATNKYVPAADANSVTKYIPLDELGWGEDESEFPVVFVCQSVLNTTSLSLHDCELLDAIGLHALRPERQSAKFFLGAHSEHQNRLAETVVCAFRLQPGSYTTEVDFDYLFPSPIEDVAYREMLKLDKEVLQKYDNVARVIKYH